jgi:hypothetical protein
MRKIRNPTRGLGTAILVGLIPIALFAVFIAIAEYGHPAIQIAAGSCYSAWIVWEIVRWFNRQDAPRHAKRPPNAPD